MPKKQVISTSAAPAAVGPYSQAVRAGGFLFLSGQLALDPKTGNMVGDDIVTQTIQVINNIKAVLGADGLTLDDVVKTTVFLKDIQDFAKMNDVYKQFFTNAPPARSAFQAVNLPRNGLVEIESIAIAE